MTTPRPALASIAAIWGSIITGSLVIALQDSHQAPSFLVVVVQRPVAVAVALLAACLCASAVLRRTFKDAWTDAMRMLPLATGIAIFVSWIGVWNDGSGTVPTSLKDGLLFIATVGVVPLSIGPDAFVRTIILVSALGIAYRAWHSGPSRVRPVVAGVFAWIVGALALLVQTWMAFAISVARDLPLAHAEDAMRALGVVHTNAYWSNFQADRFFAGVGKQLETSALLSSSSVLYLVGILLLLVAFLWSSWSRSGMRSALFRRILTGDTYASLVLTSAALCGLYVADIISRRHGWNTIDAVPIAIFLIAASGWIVRFLLGRELDRLPTDRISHPERPLASGLVTEEEVRSARDVLSVATLVGATLLGWPVLLAFLALTILGEASSAWMRSPLGRGAAYGAFAAFLVAAGGLVISRTAQYPYLLDRFEIVWAVIAASAPILAIAAVIAGHATVGWRRVLPFGVVALVGVCLATVLRLPVVLAPLALLLLILYRVRERKDIWRTYAFFGLLLVGWVASVAASLVMIRR
ncbi:hypothetical protein KJ781_01030 [Patescibacteria group bacterium]|nr:hypothetical protein [Patescibacteria group bacterium]MBU1448619.1 hypothetical protein [Patescibacteria group bacterium]MBU2613126.1 hypothetical protein [Patescibacteria group bacterium]